MKTEIHVITAGDSFSYNTQYEVKNIHRITDLLCTNNANWTNFLEYHLLKNRYNPTFYYLATPSFGNQLIIDSVLQQLNNLLDNNIDKNNIQIFVQFTYFARNLASLPIKHIQTDEQKNDYFPLIENIDNYTDVIIKNLTKIYNLATYLQSLGITFKFFFQENLFSNDEYELENIQELIDKLAAENESFVFEQGFNMDAYNKAKNRLSGGGSSSKGGSGGGSGGGSPKKSSAFKCIKDLESGLTVSGGTATLKRDSGSIHEFKSDGTYRFYHSQSKKEDKWLSGTWKCVDGGWEAYTKADGDTYYSKEGNWKTNLDDDKAAAAEAAAKAAAAIRTKGEEAAKGLLNALGGNTEDEKAVYKIFKEQITSKEIFDATEAAWGSIWPSPQDLGYGSGYYGKMSWAEIFKKHHSYTGKKGFSLRGAINNLFSDAEVGRLNGYLPSGVAKF